MQKPVDELHRVRVAEIGGKCSPKKIVFAGVASVKIGVKNNRT
tara:strand:- start:213 stop:341 length:129 start_codon:yes stop_codon:yes gene_type:complete